MFTTILSSTYINIFLSFISKIVTGNMFFLSSTRIRFANAERIKEGGFKLCKIFNILH